MHLPDGILPLPVTLGGYALSFALAAWSVARIRRDPDPHRQVPRAALLTAAFFVASLIHFPIPPVSVHLVLNGLLGAVLGWFAFPAILVGLFLQAVLFGHGGLTTLGINALILGLPALAAAGLFHSYRWWPEQRQRGAAVVLGFFAGSLALAGSLLLFAAVLFAGLPSYIDPDLERRAWTVLAVAYMPVMVLEGAITAALVAYFLRVNPAMLGTR